MPNLEEVAGDSSISTLPENGIASGCKVLQVFHYLSILVHKFSLLPVWASKMVDARTAPSPLRTTRLRPPRPLDCSTPATFMEAW